MRVHAEASESSIFKYFRYNVQLVIKGLIGTVTPLAGKLLKEFLPDLEENKDYLK